MNTSIIEFDTSLEVKKMNRRIVNWPQIQKQIEAECREYELAADEPL